MSRIEVRHARWIDATTEPVELVVGAVHVAENVDHPVTAEITLTRDAYLRERAAFAVAAGARKIRVSPCGADEVDLVRAAVEVRRIAEDHAVDVQFDAASRLSLRADPEAFLRLDPLVVEPDGTVVPLCSGLDRRYALGNLQDAPLDELVRAWDPEPVVELCRTVWLGAADGPGPLVAWYDELIRSAAAQLIGC